MRVLPLTCAALRHSSVVSTCRATSVMEVSQQKATGHPAGSKMATSWTNPNQKSGVPWRRVISKSLDSSPSQIRMPLHNLARVPGQLAVVNAMLFAARRF